MIGSSKFFRENYPRKYFRTQEKETAVKFNPGLSANRPSNNWAQRCGFHKKKKNFPGFRIPQANTPRILETGLPYMGRVNQGSLRNIEEASARSSRALYKR